MVKLLFICKNRPPYGGNYSTCPSNNKKGSYGLINSCRLLKEAFDKLMPGKIECKVVSVTDNNHIDREVHNYKPTHVFIEALWVVPEKFYELLPLHPRIKWMVRIHSKTPFLANEGIALNWIKGYLQVARKFQNFGVAGNDLAFVENMNSTFGKGFTYLPNIYWGDWKFKWPRARPEKTHLDVGCFGAIRPLKNQLQQALAAVLYAQENDQRLRFHMNGITEQRGEQVLKNIEALLNGSGHQLVLHDWLTHDEFLQLVKQMDIGLQVSLSESFNIVSADFVHQDVPVVVSPDITWASHRYQANPNCAEHIKTRMHFALSHSHINLQYLNKLALRKYNRGALKAWREYLECT